MSLVAKPIRFGLLGAAKISPHAVIAPARQTGLAVVTTVAARDPQRACSYAIRNGIPNVAESYAALIASPEVDAIYNALPPSRHARWSIAALEAGKHVLCEKPLCVTLDEARAMAAASAASGALLVESMHYRYHPQIERALQLVACGAIGALRRIEAVFNSPIPNEPGDIRWKPELGGGALLDLGIYPVSFAWDLFGAPERVVAISDPTATGVDQSTGILLGYSGARMAVLHTELDARGPNRAAIIGTEARIEIDAVWYMPTSFRVIAADGSVLESYESKVEGRGMQFQAIELERLVAEGRGPGDLLPPEESVAIMETLDEIRRQIGLSYPGE